MSALSGGSVRRVAIAAAIVAKPDVLILDEPTAGLDPVQRVAFRELICELGQSHAVILSTHLVEDVLATANETLILAEGSIRFMGTTSSLLEDGGAGDAAGLEQAYARIISGNGSSGG